MARDTARPAAADPNPLISLLRGCVVRIDDTARGFRGSGFFIAPGLAVTCGHVIHGAESLTASWDGQAAAAEVTRSVPQAQEVADAQDYPLPDLALLTVSGAGEWGHPCARLADGMPAVDGSPAGLYLAGHTDEHSAEPSLTGVSAEFEAASAESGFVLLKVKRGLIRPGLSGGPVLDRRAGSVTGVAESTRSVLADAGGFAVPASEIMAAFPDAAAASAAFHAADHRWDRAWRDELALAADRDGRRPGLPLRGPVVALPPDLAGLSPATVLRPRHAVVRYTGRDELLADIAAWCEADDLGGFPAGLWFVTGGGGYGKTRLGIEACVQAEARGWTAGLLPPEASGAQLAELAGWAGRLLVVIDYAETRPATVGRLIDEIASRRPRPAARIMLLVRRRASRDELLDLFNPQQEDQLRLLLARASVSRLEDDPDSQVSRADLFRQAAADFAALPGHQAGRSAVPRLAAAHFARPLYLLVAAYLTGMAPGTDVDALGEAGLLRELLARHEAAYWRRWDGRRRLGLDPEDWPAAVALATLLTAAGDDEALAVARLVPHHEQESETRLLAIARWLASLYPGPGAEAGQLAIGALEPDRLGEVLVADVLGRHPGLLAAACAAASDRQLTQALTVISRIAGGEETIRGQLRDVLDEHLAGMLSRAFAAEADELLQAVVRAMTVGRPLRGAAAAAGLFPLNLPAWVRPLAAEVTSLAVDGLREDRASGPEQAGQLAGMLSNLGVRLAENGQRGPALDAEQEAVALYRDLAQATPAAYLPDLAASLSNLGIRLAENGQRGPALDAAQEAVALYRDVAQATPAAYLPDLAASLSNLGNRLAENGQRGPALDAAQEAVAIRRNLAQASPAAYLPDLATSLSSLGNRLAENGQRGPALDAAQEAVALYRDLAQATPAAYLPDLAGSLSNLGIRLGENGQRGPALDAAQEAVALYRDLAQASPAAYLPDLARSLSNLGIRLGENGQRGPALDAAQEAVALYRDLAQATPAAYLPDLARSLSNLGNLLGENGQHGPALDAAQEAVALYRDLAQASPAAYLPDLARSLSNLGNLLGENGQRGPALDAAQEAVALYRDLAQATPAAYLPDLARSLSNLGNLLGENGQRGPALDAAQEAVALYRDLAQASPAAYLPDLARSLSNLGNRLAENGQRGPALDAAQEAVAIRRDLAQASPAAYLPDLATSLSNLGNRLAENGQLAEFEQVLGDVLADLAGTPQGRGHSCLVRGTWLLGQDRYPEAISDLLTAVAALAEAGDYRVRGEARQTLCQARRGNYAAFDEAWQQAGEAMPAWLQHPDTSDDHAEALIAWVQAPDWDQSRTYVDHHTGLLLTNEAEAALEHLIDVNPGSADLREHLTLLQAARADGIASAYAAHEQWRARQRASRILRGWLATPTWDASRAYARAREPDLLTTQVAELLDALAVLEPGDLTLRAHRGLLGCAKAAGLDTAYSLLSSPARRRAILAEADMQEPDAGVLAVARLHSGLSDDDPVAHFHLAQAALARGAAAEAAAALRDCASHAAPFERRDYARRLAEAPAARPWLAGIAGELAQILQPPAGTAAAAGNHQGDEQSDLAGLLSRWIDTPDWDQSEAFAATHAAGLLTIAASSMISQHAARNPGDQILASHAALHQAMVARGIPAAYAQLRSDLGQAQLTAELEEWIRLADDPAAATAYLNDHPGLAGPAAIGILEANCRRQPGQAVLWAHLGRLRLASLGIGSHTEPAAGQPGPAAEAARLLGIGDPGQALGWACLARASDPAGGALLMARIHTALSQIDLARDDLAATADATSPAGLGPVLALYRDLTAAHPDDPWLHAGNASALQRAGQHGEALWGAASFPDCGPPVGSIRKGWV